ncbi:MAG: hypothetical protein AAF490_31195 [Chloroflexota bacterium]
MEAISELIGLTNQELIQLVVVGVILLIGLFVLRAAFKLTATLLRVGCFGIALIVGLLFVAQLFF